MKPVYFVKVDVEGTMPFYRGLWTTLVDVEKWATDYRGELPKGQRVTVTVEK